jgi:hypothetical protein
LDCQRIINAPSVDIQSHLDGASFDAPFSCPIADGLSATLKSNPSGMTTVPSLLTMCSPSHISRLIVAIVVNAIKGMRRTGGTSNICEECGEVVSPSFAHLDAASTILRISIHRWIDAPPDHRIPRSPFFGASIPATFAVCRSRFNAVLRTPFSLVTPTTFGLPVQKCESRHGTVRSTFAFTLPIHIAIGILRRTYSAFNDMPSTKSLISKVVLHMCIVLQNAALWLVKGFSLSAQEVTF